MRTGAEMVRHEFDQLMQAATDPGIAAAVVMYLGEKQNTPALQALLAAGKPVVFLGREMEIEGVDAAYDSIGTNNFDSAFRIVTHLIGLGHRSIAHVTNRESVSAVLERRRGYESALEAAGLPLRPELVIAHETDPLERIDFTAERLRKMRSLPHPPTALFAVHDWAALNVLMTAHLSGLRLPRDLAIAGFDGIARFKPGPPLLTTAEQPFEEMGRHAARMITERLSGKAGRLRRCVYLEAPLRICASTDVRQGGGGEGVSNLLVRDGAWRTRLIHHFISQNSASTLTLEDLADVARVSTRQLTEDFHLYERTSPMHALGAERLKRVRWDLEHAGAATTVAEISYLWGFKHLGRFAALYQKTYGEFPSDTLRRGLGARRAHPSGAKEPFEPMKETDSRSGDGQPAASAHR